MSDIRQTQTKQRIKAALTQLLKEKSFEEVSITAICQYAHINRGTFYLHYMDKCDLMEQLKTDTLSQIEQILQEDTNVLTEDIIYHILKTIYADFDFISTIAQSSYAHFSESIHTFLLQVLKRDPNVVAKIVAYYAIPEDYALIAYSTSLEAIIEHWIHTGGKESPETITSIVARVSALPLI